MRKGLAVLSVAVTFAVVMVGMAACDDAKESGFTEGQSDADFDTGRFNAESGVATTKDGRVDCKPSLPVTFKANWTAPQKKTDCSTEQLGEYFDVCLNPINPPACKEWREKPENAACTACVEPDADESDAGIAAGPIEQHLDRYYFTLNVGGCLSLERSKIDPSESDTGKCAAAYSDSIQCQRASCTSCLPNEGAKFEDYLECQSKAKTSACAGFDQKFSAACGATFNDPDGGAAGCFRQPNDKDKSGAICSGAAGAPPCREHFVRAMAIFCGP
jgi:hypothetical protein